MNSLKIKVPKIKNPFKKEKYKVIKSTETPEEIGERTKKNLAARRQDNKLAKSAEQLEIYKDLGLVPRNATRIPIGSPTRLF